MSHITHSGLFSERRMTFSPLARPSSLSPRQKCLTFRPNSPVDRGTYRPSFL